MKSLNKYMKITFISMLIATLGAGAVANAQDLFLEEIVVTARKVEESVQDVPLSISAFSAEDISKRSIEELDDIALFTPGLTFEDFSNGGFGAPIIRGASQLSITALEQNVSTFLDGVYIPRQYALDVGSMDMERIEVVKGPQSALYGANSFMGAINYVSVKPNLGEFSGDVGVVLGDGGRTDVSGEVSFPLVPEVLAVKLGARASEYDGDWDNEFPGASSAPNPGTDDSLGGWDNSSFNFSLLAVPAEGHSLELAYHKYDTLTETRAQSRLEAGSGDLNCGNSFFGLGGRAYCGELPDTPLAIGSTAETGFAIDPRSYGLDAETDITRLAYSWDVSDSIALNYQFSNIEGEVFSAGQSDRDPLNGQVFNDNLINAFTILPAGYFDYDSHELRFEFNSDNGFYGMIGGFLLDGEDFEGGAGAYLGIPGDTNPITAQTLINNPLLVANANDNLTETEISAIFGRVSMPLMDDKLVLSAEARYSDQSKTQNIVYNDGTAAAAFEDKNFTPRVTLDYNIGDDSLLYLSVAKGIKSGGLNPEIRGGLLPAEREYQADENTTIELGSKNTFMGGALQLNASIYSIDWSNLQINAAAVNGGFFQTSIISNLGGASLQGAELDLVYAATESFTLNAGLSVNDSEYDDGVESQRITRAGICDGIVCGSTDPSTGGIIATIGGNSLPRTSDTQWNVGAQYDGMFNSGLAYFLRLDVAGQSDQYASEINTAKIPSRTLTNLRAGVNNDSWSAELWVKNATDEEYVSNAFFIASPFFVNYVPTWGNQRRIGLDLKYSF